MTRCTRSQGPLRTPGSISLGLTIEVADVLVAHGYPGPVAGSDWIGLQEALFRFIYGARP